MADALDLGSSIFDVWVQVPPPAPQKGRSFCSYPFARWWLREPTENSNVGCRHLNFDAKRMLAFA